MLVFGHDAVRKEKKVLRVLCLRIHRNQLEEKVGFWRLSDLECVLQ